MEWQDLATEHFVVSFWSEYKAEVEDSLIMAYFGKYCLALSSRNYTMLICILRDSVTYWVRIWAMHILLVPPGCPGVDFSSTKWTP